ncbi:hypothetical protein [Zooshikella ganghwensis]|uniref:Uncharacterized protein n=1 Tax=Zooshikella ganghwensis TaxID=202772 RepID=A0A4P9VQE5_9GAMM|nr:hypothetical protein [Zooshikella ganghwensis]RDH44989.1 hypothetical protein B9G39_16960 [Zooshikella ganghwensis]
MDNNSYNNFVGAIHHFVSGWSKSRTKGEVLLTHESGGVICSFDTPIGSVKRKHEAFIWNLSEFDLQSFKASINGLCCSTESSGLLRLFRQIYSFEACPTT